MWDWLLINGIWLLAVLVAGLLLFFVLWRWMERGLKKVVPDEKHLRLGKSRKIIKLTVGITGGVLIALTMVVVVLINLGIDENSAIEAAGSWFIGDGIRIFIILAVGTGLFVPLRKLLFPIVRHTTVRAKGESAKGVEKRTDTLVGILSSAGRVFIVIIISLVILSEFNIEIGPILAGLGVAGIAVGFGAQYLIRDLIAGIFIVMENQYRIGDVAKVADTVGVVEDITLRKTVLRDLDGIVHHVPNGEIRVASNYTRHFARVNFDISVAYGTDLDQAIGVINRVGQKLAEDKDWGSRIKTAPQALRVNKLGDSGIDIKVLGDVKPSEQWAVMGELRLRLKKAFDEEGIEIPWPHVKLYFGESSQAKGLICQTCSSPNFPGSRFCSSCGHELPRV